MNRKKWRGQESEGNHLHHGEWDRHQMEVEEVITWTMELWRKRIFRSSLMEANPGRKQFATIESPNHHNKIRKLIWMDVVNMMHLPVNAWIESLYRHDQESMQLHTQSTHSPMMKRIKLNLNSNENDNWLSLSKMCVCWVMEWKGYGYDCSSRVVFFQLNHCMHQW